jgi:hypothetical protein
MKKAHTQVSKGGPPFRGNMNPIRESNRTSGLLMAIMAACFNS